MDYLKWKEHINIQGGSEQNKQLWGSIIAFISHRCLIKDSEYQNTLHNILPFNVSFLPVYIIDVTLGLELSEKENKFEECLVKLDK
jgi:hypothetical protein